MYKKKETETYQNGDYPIDGFEARQHAAIMLKVPDSGELWLDEMIKESLKNDFAAKAMQGMLTNSEPCDPDAIADRAYVIADAMIAARGQ